MVGLIPYLIPVAFSPMIVMITVGPKMAALSALMTSVFHAAMQNAGIEALAISLGSALVGAFFCKEIRLRASVLKAGAMAGITGAVLAIGTGLASLEFSTMLWLLCLLAFTGGLVWTAMFD